MLTVNEVVSDRFLFLEKFSLSAIDVFSDRIPFLEPQAIEIPKSETFPFGTRIDSLHIVGNKTARVTQKPSQPVRQQ